MALGPLCHRHRQGDSESACQPVMRSLGQTSGSHDRGGDAALFSREPKADGLLLRSSEVRGVVCFKLSYESRWTASADGPAMGQGPTCIHICQLPHFQAVTLDSGNLNQIIPSFPTERPSFIPHMNPC